mgnify:CR=1 FL=1
MKKLIATINMTIDGLCDHTLIDPDEEIHQHYADLISNAGTLLYGRITYQLMEYWQSVVANPTGIKATDEFAVRMDKVPKIVFSRTLKELTWESAKIANESIEEVVATLKQQPGKDIYVGSPGMIIACANLNLIDEYQLCIHPVIAGSGLPLFKQIKEKTKLKLMKTKRFSGGAVVLYYETV